MVVKSVLIKDYNTNMPTILKFSKTMKFIYGILSFFRNNTYFWLIVYFFVYRHPHWLMRIAKWVEPSTWQPTVLYSPTSGVTLHKLWMITFQGHSVSLQTKQKVTFFSFGGITYNIWILNIFGILMVDFCLDFKWFRFRKVQTSFDHLYENGPG